MTDVFSFLRPSLGMDPGWRREKYIRGQEMAGWQPIETAPKDNPFLCLVALTLATDPQTGVANQTAAIGHRYRGVWSANATNDCGHRITHWMPLPPPPGME